MSQGNTLTLFGMAVFIAGLIAFAAVTRGGGAVEAQVLPAVTSTTPTTLASSLPTPAVDDSIRRVLADGSMSPLIVTGDVGQLPATVVRVLVERGAALLGDSAESSR